MGEKGKKSGIHQETHELVTQNCDAMDIFDSLPMAKDAPDLEEMICGEEAPFPSSITEIDDTDEVMRSENGSRFIKALKWWRRDGSND